MIYFSADVNFMNLQQLVTINCGTNKLKEITSKIKFKNCKRPDFDTVDIALVSIWFKFLIDFK